MEGQQVGVRKTIALKLRDQPLGKVDFTTTTKREEGELDSGSSSCSLPGSTGDSAGGSGPDYSEYKWDYPLHLIGRPIKDPLLHLCEQCSLPVLIYGRMKRCRHAFCRDCAKKAGGVCPHCKEGDQTFEEASMGSVHVCIYGGGRYNNKGCGRSYLSQRDLDAHILYRHNKDKVLAPPVSLGPSSLSVHFNPPPPPTSLPAGFTLPPFFQSGMIQQGLPPPPPPPPRFGPSMHPPPTMSGVMLRPPPPMMRPRPGPLGGPNPMIPGSVGLSNNLGPNSMIPGSLGSNPMRPSTIGSGAPMRPNSSPNQPLGSGGPVRPILPPPPYPLPPNSIMSVSSAPPPTSTVVWTQPTSFN